MRVILDLLLLWKTIPVLLNHFAIVKVWRDIDENGQPWTGSGPAPGVEWVQPPKQEVLISLVGAFYALQNLLSNDR